MNIGQALHTAQQLLQQGQFQQAGQLCQQIIQVQPRQVEAIHLMGIALAQLQQPQQAVTCFQQAVKLKPKVAMYHSHLGNALQTIGQFEQALQCYQHALKLNRNDADTHSNVGGVYIKLNNLPEAKKCYQKAIRLNPQHIDAHHNLSITLVKLEQYSTAREVCQKALKRQLNPAQTYVDLARIDVEEELWTQAESHIQHALNIQPNYAEAHYFLGVAKSSQDEKQQAITHYQTAIKYQPNHAESHLSLGNIYALQEQWDKAQHYYQKAIQIKPHFPDAYANLAKAKQKAGEVKTAIQYYEQALKLRPHCFEYHLGYAQILLAAGQFEQGWISFLYRPTRTSSSADFKAIDNQFEVKPLAEDLTGKHIFIHKDQGLGDELLFLRFIPWLKQRGAQVTYQCGKKIYTMLQRVEWIDNLIEAKQPFKELADAKYLVGDLPLALGMNSVDSIPEPVQLSVLPEKLALVKAQLPQDGKPIIGLTWRAGQPPEDVSKKFRKQVLQKLIPLDLLIQVLKDIDAHFIILQRNAVDDEVELLKQALSQQTYDLTHFSDDLESMLALMSLLDDYVGVSNTNMHLRIGVGKTARVLVPSPPDWRWMDQGCYSRWFDGFTVYRQADAGGWDDCFEQLGQDLRSVFLT